MKIKKNNYTKTIEINNNIKNIYEGFNIEENKYKEKSKSKKLTNDGVVNGAFPFFTSSNQQSLFDNEFMIDGSYLILGDGGDYPSLNYYSGKFSYSSHTLVLDYETNDNLYMYYYWLKNINELDRCFQGSKLKNIKRSLFIKTQTIVPDIESQRKISKLLYKSTLNIQKIKSLIEKIEIRNQYYADKLLDGTLTIENNIIVSKNNKNNQKIKITDYIDVINGYPFKSAEMKNEGKYAVIKMSNFKDKKVSILKNNVYTNLLVNKVQLMKNDLLIGLSGSVGEYAIFNLDEICLLNQRCIILRNKNNEIGNYVKTYIISKVIEDLKNNSEGGVIKNVSSNFFENIEILLPSNHKEIVKFLHNINEEKEKVEKLLKLEEQRFEWLSDKLLSGEYIIED